MQSSVTPSAQSLLIHDAFLRRVVRYLISEGDDVDDVVQEVWVAALKKPPKRTDAARSWLWSVASNVVRLRLRTRIRSNQRERKMARPNVAPSSEEIREREAVRSMVLEQLLTLPDEARDVLVLRFFEDLSWKQVARRLGVPPETARTRAKRARALLRERIATRSGGDPSSVLLLLPLFDIQNALRVAGTKPLLLPRAAAIAAVVAGVAGLWALLPTQEPQREPGTAPAPPATTTARATPTTQPAPAPHLVGQRRDTDTDPTAPPETSWHVTGRVVDEAHRPLAGVAVAAGDPHQPDITKLAWQTRTRADGGFAMAVPRPQHALRVAAHVPGRAPAVRHLRAAPDNLVLVLPATGLRHFVLLDRDTDRPLEGVRCTYVAQRGSHDLAVSAESNEQGHVAIEAPWPTTKRFRKASLRFALRGFTPAFRDEQMRATGGDSLERATPVYLSRADDHPVRVIDEADAPVARARVRVWSGDRFGPALLQGVAFARSGDVGVAHLADVMTDAEGLAHFPLPGEGRRILIMAATADARGFFMRPSFGRHRTGEVTVRIRPTRSLHGQVLHDGQPVAGAEVMLPLSAVFDPARARSMRHAPAPLLRLLQVRTDAEGQFRLTDLPLAFHGRTLRLIARDGTLGEGQIHFGPDADLQRPLVIALPGGATTRITVHDDAGRPIRGAEVIDRSRARRSWTGESGIALLAREDRTAFPIQVVAEGYGTVESRVQVGEDAIVTLHTRRTLSGRVVDAQGVPARADVALVQLLTDASGTTKRVPLGRHRTSGEGWFTFEDAREGPWEIVAAHPGTATASRHEIATTKDAQTIALPPRDPDDERLEIGGHVIGHDGARVTRYEIMLRAQPPAKGMWRATLRGHRFLFTDLAPGAYRLEAWTGARKTYADVVLRAGQSPPTIVLKYPNLASISGQLMIPVGYTSKMLRPRLRKPDGPWHYGAITDDDGRFTFRQVLPGSYVLGLQPVTDEGTWWVVNPKITVVGGDKQNWQVDVRPAGRLRIAIVDRRLRPRRRNPMRASAYTRVTPGAPAPRTPKKAAEAPDRVIVRTPAGTEIDLGPIRFGTFNFDEALLPGTYDLRVATKLGTYKTSFEIRAHQQTLIETTFPE